MLPGVDNEKGKMSIVHTLPLFAKTPSGFPISGMKASQNFQRMMGTRQPKEVKSDKYVGIQYPTFYLSTLFVR
ncbi:hypothetical protein AM500_03025 [Bacillus sp. FJAT-18017]|nr:hypothetical protein AM500_03025 [Bacillus sp. FJAT-18017]